MDKMHILPRRQAEHGKLEAGFLAWRSLVGARPVRDRGATVFLVSNDGVTAS
jgi:hypothetical protein